MDHQHRAAIAFHVPPLLKRLTGGAGAIAVPWPPANLASNRSGRVIDAIRWIETQHHGFAAALIPHGDLPETLAIFIDGEQAPMGLQTTLQAGAEVRVIPPIVGG